MIRRVVAAAFVVATLGVACAEDKLPARSKVITPRILAVIAEPPEAGPGQSARIRVVTGGTTMPPTFRWLVCANQEATTTFTASSTFGVAEPNEGCFGENATGVVALPGTGPEVAFTVPANVLEQLDALQAVYGRNLPPETLRRIARTVGLPVTIAVEMTHGAVTERAIKRLVIVDRTDRNANPPRPTFRVGVSADGGTGGVHLAAVPNDNELCAPSNRAPITVRRGQRVEIAPDPTEEPWLQEYDQLDSSGAVSRTRESAYYAFFATDGWFAQERTRIPTRNTVWNAPEMAMAVTHWLVMRDGRGGTSVCRFNVVVE